MAMKVLVILSEGSAVPVRSELMQILRCAQNDRLSGEAKARFLVASGFSE
jgi:hypothetical protein